MYRKDVLDGQGHHDAGEADLAAGRRDRRAGRRRRARAWRASACAASPGWGQVFAPLTTVVNTFGGTWFTEDWQAQVNAPEFTEATKFYVDLVREHGENGAPQAGFTECLNNLIQGNAAMWYDATSAAGSLEADGLPGARARSATSPAPVVETESSGWLYAWSWGIQEASEKKDDAWKFISWASSKEYEELVGERARLVAACRPASGPRPTRTRSTSRRPRRSPSRPAGRHRERRPAEPRRAAAAGARHPVRRHPGVHRPGHPGLAGRQLGDRRADERRRGPGPRARSSPRTSPNATERGSRSEPPLHRRHGPSADGPRGGAPLEPPAPAAGRAARRADRRSLAGGRLGPARPAAARADLHDRRDPAAVRGDAGHLVHELERLLPRRARLRRPRQLPSRASPTSNMRDVGRDHDPADRRRSCSSAWSSGLRHRAAAGPQVPRPRRRSAR